jgi:hypothetical protein
MTDAELTKTPDPAHKAGAADVAPAGGATSVGRLAVPVIHVDRHGVVVQVNELWRHEEPGPGVLAEVAVGINLVEHCRRDGTLMGQTVADGIASVIGGARPGFCHEYVLRTVSGSRRFMLAITRCESPDGGATILLFDVSRGSSAATICDGFDWVFRQCLSDMFMFDGQSLRFLQVSEGMLRNLGYTNDDMLAMTPVDIEPGATRESFRQRLSPLREGTTPKLEFVSVFQRRDGTTYPVEIHLQRVAAGGAVVYFAIALDVTRGTATEQLINEASAIMDTTADAMAIVDDEGRIRVANERMATLFGYSLSELRGMDVDALLPARLRATHSLNLDAAGGRTGMRGLGANLSLAALTKDGQELPVEVCLNPVTTRDGMLVAAAIRDLTDVERTRRALHESEERYRDLFENASDIIQIMDTDGQLTYVNPAWRRTLGYDNNDAVTMNLCDTMDEQQAAVARATLQRLRAGMPLEEVAWQLQTKAGKLLEFEGSADCQRSNGQILGFRVILHDVTQRNAYEAALVEDKIRAERAATTKSRFLAAAGHDLRQPLHSLSLYLAVLSRRVEDPLVEEIGRKMRVSVDAMSSLVDALLDISRFDAGMVVPRQHDFALVGLLNRIVNDNVQQAQRKGLTLTCCPCDYVIHSDPALLERIVENFVTNAIRYTESGRIEIGCDQIDETTLRIYVKDTGIGIPGDHVEHIFDEYYQVGNAARERGRGLGLGLSIVKHVARLLDLPLHVTSTLGTGSVFAIDVPFGDAHSLREASRRTSVVHEATGERRPVVLVVDDDTSIVDATSMFLNLAGYDVSCACSREQVESILDTGTVPDVLVTDYRLPGVSGIELVRLVRHRLDKAVPAILISGDTSLTDRDAEKLPDSSILRKPVKTETLLSLIDAAIRDHPLE